MGDFRFNTPIRSLKTVSDYKEAFEDLRADFDNKCGYCDTSDRYLTIDYFEIDHFKPKSKFEDLKHEYSNLVYSCKNCNMFKSSYWASDSPDIFETELGNEGMVDPCSQRYTNLYTREENGQILPTEDPLSEFIYKRLKLYLYKRTFYNRLGQIDDKISMIKNHENINLLTHEEMCKIINMKDDIQDIVNEVEMSYKLKR